MYRDVKSFDNIQVPVETTTQPTFDSLEPQPWPQQWQPSEDFPTPQSVGEDEFSQTLNKGLNFSTKERKYKLGESHLPVAAFREHFLDTVASSSSTVVSSETGSGKSSQLGLFLLEAGYPRIFVTQPRILAARELKERAQKNLGPEHAYLAGYLTGKAADSDCHPDARLIFITEQKLFKMANRNKLRPDDAVIADEAHERTTPMIFMLGLVRRLQRTNPDLKLIISSATINTKRWSKYLKDDFGDPAPVMALPGRTFPVKRSVSTESVAAVAKKYMKLGHNVLAFESGIASMKTTWATMSSRMRDKHTVHMLYGDMSPREQRAALNPADGHHIVANKIGETSITPLGKDVVVDSGQSNIGLYERGVSILATVFSSQDVMNQRAGRVGRTAPGEYVEATPDDAPPPPKFEDREAYGLPPIQTGSVATYLAELYTSNTTIDDLDLLESPTAENLEHDYKILARLGAIAIDEGERRITPAGRQMVDLPLDVALARMVVEARNLSPEDAEDPEAIHLQAAAAASIQQAKGILSAEGTKRRYLITRRNQEQMSKENSSDLLFELDVFTKMYIKQQELKASGDADYEAKFEMLLRSKDVLPKRYYSALGNFEEVAGREDIEPTALRQATAEERKLLVGCQITGAQELFVKRGKFVYDDIRGDRQRRLGKKSTILHGSADLVVGTAFNLRGMRARGNYEKRFIIGGSTVTREQILKHAPHRVTNKRIGYGITRQGTLMEKQSLYFDDELPFGEVQADLSPTIETREFIIRAMMTGAVPRIEKPTEKVPFHPATPNATRAIYALRHAKGVEDRSLARLRVEERFQKLVQKIVKDSVKELPLEVTDLASIDAVIPSVYPTTLIRPSRRKKVATILAAAPEGINIVRDETNVSSLQVYYKDNVAYVTVPREISFKLKREDFAEVEQNRPVKIRFGSGKYQRIDTVFETMQRQEEKRERKAERKAELLAAAAESVVHGTETTVEYKKGRRPRELSKGVNRLMPVPVKSSKQRRRFTQPRTRNQDILEQTA